MNKDAIKILKSSGAVALNAANYNECFSDVFVALQNNTEHFYMKGLKEVFGVNGRDRDSVLVNAIHKFVENKSDLIGKGK